MWFIFYAKALLTPKILMPNITFWNTVLHVHADIYCVTDSPTVKVLTSYKAAIIIIVVFTCTVAVLITAYTRWHLELSLFWKDRFGKLEDGNINTHMFGRKTPSLVCLCKSLWCWYTNRRLCLSAFHISKVPEQILIQFHINGIHKKWSVLMLVPVSSNPYIIGISNLISLILTKISHCTNNCHVI
jgi:hypothetical protein